MAAVFPFGLLPFSCLIVRPDTMHDSCSEISWISQEMRSRGEMHTYRTGPKTSHGRGVYVCAHCALCWDIYPLILYMQEGESKGNHRLFYAELLSLEHICIHGFHGYTPTCHYQWCVWLIAWIPSHGCIYKLPGCEHLHVTVGVN